MVTLSIVIPVYNAERTVETLCNALIYLYARSYQLQIVLVNDGSKDNSDARCRNLAAAYPDLITYVKLARNFGEHNAVMAGLNHASGEFCVIMDDDLQNPPEEVRRLVEEIQKGRDVVYARYESKKDNLFRNLGSAFNDRMATLFLKKPVDLYLSSFKVLNRFLVKEVIKYTGPAPYVDAIILRTTDNIGAISLEHRSRMVSRSGYTFGKLVAIWGNMVVSFSLVPLRIIGLVGACLAVFGIGYGVYKAYDDLNSTGRLSDYETLMSANLFFRGVVMLALSIVGEYVGRIYLSQNSDPQFVIRELVAPGRKQGPVKNLSEYARRDEQHGQRGSS